MAIAAGLQTIYRHIAPKRRLPAGNTSRVDDPRVEKPPRRSRRSLATGGLCLLAALFVVASAGHVIAGEAANGATVPNILGKLLTPFETQLGDASIVFPSPLTDTRWDTKEHFYYSLVYSGAVSAQLSRLPGSQCRAVITTDNFPSLSVFLRASPSPVEKEAEFRHCLHQLREVANLHSFDSDALREGLRTARAYIDYVTGPLLGPQGLRGAATMRAAIAEIYPETSTLGRLMRISLTDFDSTAGTEGKFRAWLAEIRRLGPIQVSEGSHAETWSRFGDAPDNIAITSADPDLKHVRNAYGHSVLVLALNLGPTPARETVARLHSKLCSATISREMPDQAVLNCSFENYFGQVAWGSLIVASKNNNYSKDIIAAFRQIASAIFADNMLEPIYGMQIVIFD